VRELSKPDGAIVVTQIRIPTQTHKALQTKARESERSLNSEMVRRLKESLAEEKTHEQ